MAPKPLLAGGLLLADRRHRARVAPAQRRLTDAAARRPRMVRGLTCAAAARVCQHPRAWNRRRPCPPSRASPSRPSSGCRPAPTPGSSACAAAGPTSSGARRTCPALGMRRGEELRRFDSLPDARFGRDPAVWRATYLVPAALMDPAPGRALALVGERRARGPARARARASSRRRPRRRPRRSRIPGPGRPDQLHTGARRFLRRQPRGRCGDALPGGLLQRDPRGHRL